MQVFHDWIEVTKKRSEKFDRFDSPRFITFHTPEQGAYPDFHRGYKEKFNIGGFAKVSTTERDLERRWIEGRGDASTARPWFNSSLENIFHGVM